MVDEVRVLRLLRSVTDDLAVLRRETPAGAKRRADPLWLRGIKYTFVTAIEACVDVAQHLWPSGCRRATNAAEDGPGRVLNSARIRSLGWAMGEARVWRLIALPDM